ncbi:unnamed protein product [Blepharisma stoltei]|uniref:UBC core domain-containing protein n=1 Tax=Blepharisma stoltei TaxID=1481888 RepID=A0AAU9ITB5_9CILI|nr:unnamed protein product [Blepharisma stoltei]
MERLQAEFNAIQSESHPEYSVEIVNNNFFHWKGTLQGPQDTPYQNGKFRFEIVFPQSYPASPPEFFFKTKIFHPNIYEVNGETCVRVLNISYNRNIPVRIIIAYVFDLLANPNPDAGYVQDSTHAYLYNRPGYTSMAAEWTRLYAI